MLILSSYSVRFITKGPDDRKQDSLTETIASSVLSSKRSSKTPRFVYVSCFNFCKASVSLLSLSKVK